MYSTHFVYTVENSLKHSSMVSFNGSLCLNIMHTNIHTKFKHLYSIYKNLNVQN